MARKRSERPTEGQETGGSLGGLKKVFINFLNTNQQEAFDLYQKNQVLFLTGPAGTGKSFIAMAFAIQEILSKQKDRIVITRPIVEAGEKLGFLPGSAEEKVAPYMMPLFDCINKICGPSGSSVRSLIEKKIEIAPLAYLRGRAQPLDSTVMTPDGPTKMSDIKVGDYVLGSNGEKTKVLGVYPQGKKEIVEVVFNDGSSTYCCKEHLWSTQTLSEKRHEKPYSVKTTTEIMKCIKTRHGQKNHRIPILSQPAEFKFKEVPLSSYLLGLLIGDGCLHDNAGISFCTADEELVESAKNCCPAGVLLNKKTSAKYDYCFKQEKREWCSSFKNIFRELDLLGKKSYEKFVPDVYLYNSAKIRLAVLQGLMDTDGSVYKDRDSTKTEFSTTSEKLAKDVMFLVQSLGGTTFLYEKQHEDTGHWLKDHLVMHKRISYKVIIHLPENVNPFRLSRKAQKWRPTNNACRLIAEIKEAGEKECQCISVEASDHLYLTDNFIVTHNTLENCVAILDESQNCSPGQIKLFLTRLGQNAKMIVTGDPEQSDLYDQPDLVRVAANLRGVKDIGHMHFSDADIVRNPLIAEILKRI